MRDFWIENGVLKKYYGIDAHVVVPDGVRTVGKEAFSRTEIESVLLPDSVRTVGESAFASCSRLVRADLGNGVRTLRKGAFMGCSRLVSLRLSEKTSSIGEWAFWGCDALREIHAPAPLLRKPFRWWMDGFDREQILFVGVSNVAERNAILRYIRESRSAVMETLDVMKEYRAYRALPNLLSAWKRVPLELLRAMLEKVEEDQEARLLLMEYFSRVYPADELARLEQDRMDKELGIKPLTVADWKERFQFEVNGEGGLTILRYLGKEDTVYLPKRIGRREVTEVHVGSVLFRRKWGGLSFLADADNAYFSTVDGDLYTKDGRTLLAFSPNGRGREYTVAAGVKRIGRNAFYGGKTLESVTLPAGVRWIDDYAFTGCTNLSRLQLPDSLASIGEGAFARCTDLSHLRLPPHLQSIARDAFLSCRALVDLQIPDSVRSIGEEAFASCTGLKRVHLGHGLRVLKKRTFVDCHALTAITLCRETQTVFWSALHTGENKPTLLYDGSRSDWERVEKLGDEICKIEFLKD